MAISAVQKLLTKNSIQPFSATQFSKFKKSSKNPKKLHIWHNFY